MKFLLVTDLHYSDKPTGDNNRYHQMSLDKFRYAIDNYSQGCEFIACLGDIADSFEGYKSQTQLLGEIGEMLSDCSLPFYATFGNHDTALDKSEFIRLTGMPDRYYSFETDDYLCIMLDTCMNSKDEPYPAEEIVWQECFIDSQQLEWLRAQLENSTKPVVIFTHILLVSGVENEVDHILNNADEVKEILLANEEKVTAVFFGHYHFGTTAKIGSIPTVTFKGLCMGKEITCAEVEITDGKIVITGHGDEDSVVYVR